MDGLTEGRIVHFVMPDGEHRPAIVVKVWDKERGSVNLSVFTDHSNDLDGFPPEGPTRDSVERGLLWATSVKPDEETKARGTWHWIEKA